MVDSAVFSNGVLEFTLPLLESPSIESVISKSANPEGPRVFISHSTNDKEFVYKLSNDLRRAGIRIWRDDIEIKVGDSIVSGINEGLAACDSFIVVLSRNSVPSTWVKREMDAAFVREASGASIRILPVRLDDIEAPPLISALRFADFRTSYENGCEELLEALRIAD